MAQYFLASVGVAEAFRKQDNQLVHFFSAKTLTDSTINLSVSAEEVRGGQGAQLLGQFFHTSSFGLQMTDAMFKLEYLQAQVGGDIIEGGYGLKDEEGTVDSEGYITLSKAPIELLPGTGPIAWYNRPGQTDYKDYPFGEDYTGTTYKIQIPGAQPTVYQKDDAGDVIKDKNGNPLIETEGDKFCIHYYTSKADARTLLVKSDFVPSELVVFLTTRLFAGDASAPETGKPVGSVTVKIPRFQLNGTVDLAMAMASAATINLQGTALSYDESCSGGKYAEIVEYLELSPYDGYTALRADADTATAGNTPVIYAVGSRKIPMLMDNDDINFEGPGTADGKLTDGKLPAATAAEQVITMTYTYTDSNGKEKEIPGKITIPASA